MDCLNCIRKLKVALLLTLVFVVTGCATTVNESYAMKMAQGLEIDEGLKDIRLTPEQWAEWEQHQASRHGGREAKSLARTMDTVGNAAILAEAGRQAYLIGGFDWSSAISNGPLAVASLFNIAFQKPIPATAPAIAIRAPVAQYEDIDAFEKATIPIMNALVEQALQDLGWSTSLAPHVNTFRWEKSRWEERYQDVVMSKAGECDRCVAFSFLSGFTDGKEIHTGMNDARYKSTFELAGAEQKYFVKIGTLSFRQHPVWSKRKEDVDANTAYQQWEQAFYAAVARRAPDNVLVYVPHLSNIPSSMPVIYHRGEAHYFIKPPKREI